MSKKVPSLERLIRAISTHYGFSVHLIPLTVAATLTETAPATAPALTLAQRIGTVEDAPAPTPAPTAPTAPDPMAPHGRDAAGNPLAPHGWLADGSRPRKTAAGRPANAAAPTAPTAPTAPIAAPVAMDFGGALAGLGSFSLTMSDVQPAPVAPVTASSVLDELEMDLG